MQLAKFQDENKIAIFNLNFIRVIVHEIAHVALRHTFTDFNISTSTFQNGNKTTQKLDEAGLIAENMLFKARIDWMESAENGFDLDYCKHFMQSLFNLNLIKFYQKQLLIIMLAWSLVCLLKRKKLFIIEIVVAYYLKA